jgi:cyclic beta-1,2-glucan synthetase
MDPCIPKKWTEYSINYKYLDTSYEIKVSNPNGVSKGVKQLIVNGKVINDNVFNLINDGKVHKVEVIMGK